MPVTEDTNNPGRICPRCQHQRSTQEQAPEWQCPNCYIAYPRHRPTPKEDSQATQTIPINKEPAAQNSASPLPWVCLLIGILLAFSYACYNHFQWPDADKITLFTSDQCGPDCNQAREWLNDNGVLFVEKNIDSNKDHRSSWEQVGADDMPLAFFGAERISGYNKTIYQIALTGFRDRMNDNINQTVILFSAANCTACSSGIELLNKKKIPFEEYDIGEIENLNVYRELFGRELPLMFVGNIRLDGYDKETLEFALKQVDLLK